MTWLRVLLALTVLTMGCDKMLFQRYDPAMWSTYSRVNQLQLGMSRTEVEGVMGPPGVKEEGDYLGGRYTFYFYLTHSMDFEESNTVRNGYTPLVFQDNRLVGIGKRSYRRAVDRPEDGRIPESPWNRVK
jgi:outer membrane protein assembly factor BamE (lipoprotein component of BamABCDE complex)